LWIFWHGLKALYKSYPINDDKLGLNGLKEMREN
jgi:hypothetical protein